MHGCAPDIAGKDIANPLASILSVTTILRLGSGRADAGKALAAGYRTRDLATTDIPISAETMGDLVVRALS